MADLAERRSFDEDEADAGRPPPPSQEGAQRLRSQLEAPTEKAEVQMPKHGSAANLTADDQYYEQMSDAQKPMTGGGATDHTGSFSAVAGVAAHQTSPSRIRAPIAPDEQGQGSSPDGSLRTRLNDQKHETKALAARSPNLAASAGKTIDDEFYEQMGKQSDSCYATKI